MNWVCTVCRFSQVLIVHMHLEPRFSVYAMHIHGIYHVYVDVLHILWYTWNIRCISMEIPCISIEVDTMYIHRSGYTCYIHTVYTWYIIWCIYMVYMWYIYGYSWIFLAFWHQILRPASAAGLIQCAHVCGWSRGNYSTPHHGNARGKGGPQKAQPDCHQPSPSAHAAAVTAAVAVVLQASFRFPSLVPGNNLNLGERWGRGSLQGRWPMCRTA